MSELLTTDERATVAEAATQDALQAAMEAVDQVMRAAQAAMRTAMKTAQETMKVAQPRAADLSGDPLLNKAESCTYCHLTYPSLWKATKTGDLAPARYMTNRVFWLRSELDAFIASRPRQKIKAAV